MTAVGERLGRWTAALTLALLAGGCATTSLPTASPSPAVAAVAEPAPLPAPPVPAPSDLPAAAPVEPVDAAALRAARPMPRLDPGADAERADLWQRLRNGLSMPDHDDELVRRWEQYYAQRPDYVARMMERGSRYLFHIVEEVDRRGLPMELALLPFIESAFNPQAMSRAAASGMWQFMPATGRSMELTQNVFRDDRRSVLASTQAALTYLQQLHARFGDWHLALAAYNWGQGNVNKALTANERRGLPRAYANLRMPNETREYVPKLQAMKNIVLRPDTFGLSLPTLENHPYFLSVAITRDLDVELAASLSGLSLDAFQQLNPQLNKPVILAAGTPQVLLPYDNANRFVKALQAHVGPTSTWTAWRAPRTLKPVEAAKLVGMSEPQLRAVNAIPARMLVKAGSILVVPRSDATHANVAEHIADGAALALAPEAKPRRAPAAKATRGHRPAAGAKGVRTAARKATPTRTSQRVAAAPNSRRR